MCVCVCVCMYECIWLEKSVEVGGGIECVSIDCPTLYAKLRIEVRTSTNSSFLSSNVVSG